MNVRNIIIDKNSKVSWLYENRLIELFDEHCVQVEFDEKSDLLYLFYEYDNKTFNTVKLYTPEGLTYDVIKCVPNFYFSYLTKHTTIGVTIVACGNQKIDGWYDWQFAYNKDKKEIRRVCPSY